MNLSSILALVTLSPVLAAAIGSLIASVRAPGPQTASVVQHFTAGIVFAAAALELLPQDRMHATLPVVVGFALGLALMLGIRKFSNWLEGRFESAGFPTGLILVTAVDLLIDGLVLGIAFTAGEQTGLILTVALTLEVLFLALSVSAALGAARVKRSWSFLIPVGLAALMSAARLAAMRCLLACPRHPTPRCWDSARSRSSISSRRNCWSRRTRCRKRRSQPPRFLLDLSCSSSSRRQSRRADGCT